MAFRKIKPDDKPRRVPKSQRLTGERKIGEKRIEVSKGVWVFSSRKESVVIAEYQEKQRRMLESLKSKSYSTTPEYQKKHREKMKKKFHTDAAR